MFPDAVTVEPTGTAQRISKIVEVAILLVQTNWLVGTTLFPPVENKPANRGNPNFIATVRRKVTGVQQKL